MSDATCSVPGCDLTARSRSWCDKHYQRWYRYGSPEAPDAFGDGQCAQCDEATPGRVRVNGPRRRYCSNKCRNRASYERRLAQGLSKRSAAAKVCPSCLETFVPERTAKQRFCAKRCQKRWQNKRDVQAKPMCAEAACRNKSVSGGFCRKHHPTAASWSRGTAETRRNNLRRRTQRRRALTRDAAAEVVDRDEIGARDGWRCGLCFKRVNPALSYPDPRSPSLDHILPLSLGGKHARVNVQITHLACNVSKGNRGGGEQLLLVG